jgi:hypothetical protein
MIQLAEDIGYEDYRKIPLEAKYKKVLIEVASNRKLDVAVANEKQMKAFDEAEDAENVDIDWIENIRSYDFEFEFPPEKQRHYLILWNSNEEYEDDEGAIAAYKITAIE